MITKHPGTHQVLTEKPAGALLKLYRVQVSGVWYGYHIVEAASAEQADALAQDLPVPEHVDYEEYTTDDAEEIKPNAAR